MAWTAGGGVDGRGWRERPGMTNGVDDRGGLWTTGSFTVAARRTNRSSTVLELVFLRSHSGSCSSGAM